MVDSDGIGDTGAAEVDNTDTEGSGGIDNTGAADADNTDTDEEGMTNCTRLFFNNAQCLW